MQIDYRAIGKRVREQRKAQGISQEKLAEKVNISPPHMSNIENGKTKFSMQVLIDIANVLDTTPDVLLRDHLEHTTKTQGMVLGEIGHVLTDCTPVQMTMIEETVKNTKKLLQAYDKRLRKEFDTWK